MYVSAPRWFDVKIVFHRLLASFLITVLAPGLPYQMYPRQFVI